MKSIMKCNISEVELIAIQGISNIFSIGILDINEMEDTIQVCYINGSEVEIFDYIPFIYVFDNEDTEDVDIGFKIYDTIYSISDFIRV